MEIYAENDASQHSINFIKYRVPEKQPYRTWYHFQPPQNWMNDPNGPMYYKGVCHFFFQHNPYAPYFGDKMVWAHSISYDLINWTHLIMHLNQMSPMTLMVALLAQPQSSLCIQVLMTTITKGWTGLQSIPRQVWLDKSGKQLMQWPIEEVQKLRDKQVSILGEKLVGGSTLEVSGITASQADVEVLFELPELESAEWLHPNEVDPQLLCSEEYASKSGTIGPFGLLALASEDLTEQTAIFFRIYRTPDGYACLMCSDQSRSSLRQGLDKTTYATIFDIDPNLKTISLRSLIDRSIIESFGEEGRICITSRVYPLLAIDKDAHLYVFNNGIKSVLISKLNAWSMKHAEFGHLEK